MNVFQNISALIPQGAPFIMVDEILILNEMSVTTQLTIREDNVFVEDNFFQEPGLIENIAQSAAAKVGYHAMVEKKQAPMGFIGAVHDLEIFNLPKVNDKIQTEIIIENEIFNVILIFGKILCNDILMAKCKMKIFVTNN